MGAPKGKPHRKFAQAEKLAYITCIRCNGRIYEWVLFIDTFNNEIIAHRGDPKTYYNCLDQPCKCVKNVKEQTAGTVLHTD